MAQVIAAAIRFSTLVFGNHSGSRLGGLDETWLWIPKQSILC